MQKPPIESSAAAHTISVLFDPNQFRQTLGALPSQFHAQFLGAVLQDLEKAGAGLLAACAAQDCVTAERHAHALKGVAGHIGAIGLQCAVDEFRGNGSRPDGPAFSKLGTAHAATLAECAEYHRILTNGRFLAKDAEAGPQALALPG